MGSRDDIAAALTATGRVKVTPHHRQSLRPGDGCVRFAGMTAASNGFGFVTTWEVWIAIPQEVKAGELWLEANLPALLTALEPEVIVTNVTPVELALGGPNTTNGVILEGAREADNI